MLSMGQTIEHLAMTVICIFAAKPELHVQRMLPCPYLNGAQSEQVNLLWKILAVVGGGRDESFMR